jgi:hypothetical protein
MSCARAAYARLDAAVSDEACGYTTNKVLKIKDRRIGILLGLLRAAILGFIIYEAATEQLYLVPSDLSVSVRLQARAPASDYRWGVNQSAAGQAPFCINATAPFAPSGSAAMLAPFLTRCASSGEMAGPDMYCYNGVGPFPRRDCLQLDANLAVPYPESDRAFLLTNVAKTRQAYIVTPANGARPVDPPLNPVPGNFSNPLCASGVTAGCQWFPPANETAPLTTPNNTVAFPGGVTSVNYVPDIEYFTILVDHSMIAPQASIERTVRQMSGEMRDKNGRPFDPCSVYRADGLDCPASRPNALGGFTPGVNVGVLGFPDVIPIKALMVAAGVPTLDAIAGSENADAANQRASLRQQGMLLILDISYSNYFRGRTVPGAEIGDVPVGGTGSYDSSVVRYTYRAYTVPATQFNFNTATVPFPAVAAAEGLQRDLERLYGVRLLVTTSGRIGFLNIVALVTNLVVSLSLLGIAVTIVEFGVFTVCPLRNFFRKMRESETVRVGDLLAAARARPLDFKALLRAAEGGGGGGKRERSGHESGDEAVDDAVLVREARAIIEGAARARSAAMAAGNPLSVLDDGAGGAAATWKGGAGAPKAAGGGWVVNADGGGASAAGSVSSAV